jgi:hypothetical protein
VPAGSYTDAAGNAGGAGTTPTPTLHRPSCCGGVPQVPLTPLYMQYSTVQYTVLYAIQYCTIYCTDCAVLY